MLYLLIYAGILVFCFYLHPVIGIAVVLLQMYGFAKFSDEVEAEKKKRAIDSKLKQDYS